MHKIRHALTSKKGEEVWVEPRAKEAWEKATKTYEDRRSSQPSECGSSTLASLTLEEETRIWLEVNGGVKKGSAYGLGTMYASDKLNPSFLGSYAPASSVDPSEMARMKNEIAELKRLSEQQRLENEANMNAMRDMMQNFLSKSEKRKKMDKGKGKSKGKGKAKR